MAGVSLMGLHAQRVSVAAAHTVGGREKNLPPPAEGQEVHERPNDNERT